jgi:predicted nucleic acid-binding protein
LDKAVVVDANIASVFAKIERLDLLLEILSKHSAFITTRIFEELSVPLDYGYTFPLDIFRRFDIIYPTAGENDAYQEMLVGNRSLGRGELEAICICKNRGYIFLSMDNASLIFAQSLGVETLKLHTLLRFLWKSGMRSKDEVKTIIREIEEKDKTSIKDSYLIFK